MSHTLQKANRNKRVLIYNRFGTYETLEILEFYFENDILLYYIPSYTSYKLQPYNVSVFGPLKGAYRNQVERLERVFIGIIGKEHFTYLYCPARMEALTFRNIRAGWTKAGLFPFNPEKVLSDIPQPRAESTAPIMNEVRIGYYSQVTSPKTPVTPVSVEAVASLHQLIKQDTHLLDEASKQRLQWRVQKLTSAT